jgi:hypothetical protein
MPRNYQKEYNEYHSTPKQKKRRAARNAARQIMIASGAARKGDGKDVDHKDRNPQNNARKNLRMTSQKRNRGWRKGS